MVSEIPKADPGVLVISTIKGPEALATVSGTWRKEEFEMQINIQHLPPSQLNPHYQGGITAST